jgi:3-methyladenine DNA glycosylase AlkD
MRDKFQFLGIQKPIRSELQKELLKLHGIPAITVLEELVGLLWEAPEREFQYAAIDLMHLYAQKLPFSFIRIIESMILIKSWWDTVDLVSSKLAGNWFLSYPDEVEKITNEWIAHESMWLNRAALLYQLTYKEQTNSNRLFLLINRKISSQEFFIQKAIGWALRQYARTAPEKVLEFVNRSKLPTLSLREAKKHLK